MELESAHSLGDLEPEDFPIEVPGPIHIID
jgi:hypothetical protein